MATINAISVALFNAAAGGYSAEMTSNGAAFANAVGPVLEKDISTDALFVEHLLGNLGVTSSNAVYAQAKAAVAGLVTAKGRLGATVDAIDFLKAQEGSTSAYASIAANFAAKVNTAAAFTAANATERDITKLVSAITGVDTDAAAISAAAAAATAAAEATAAAAANAAATAAAAAAAAAAAEAKAAAEKVAADAAAAAKAAADTALAAVDNTTYASEQAALDAANAAAATAAAAAKAVADAAATKAAADLAAANLTIATLRSPVGTSTALTTSVDTIVGVEGGNDTITGTTSTISGDGDVIVDRSTTDNDTLNLTLTSALTNAEFAVVSGIENINVDWNAFGTATLDAEDIRAATITVSSNKLGYLGNLTVNNAQNNNIVAGTNVDGTIDINGGSTVSLVATTGAVTVDSDASATSTANVTGGTTVSVGAAAAFATTTVTANANTTSITIAGNTANVTGGAATTSVSVTEAEAATVTANSATTVSVAATAASTSKSTFTIGATNASTITVDGTAATTDAATITAGKAAVALNAGVTTALETVNLTTAAGSTVTLGTGSQFTTMAVTSSGATTVNATSADVTGKTITDSTAGGLTVGVTQTAATVLTNVAGTINLKASSGHAMTLKNGATVNVAKTVSLNAGQTFTVAGTGTSDAVTVSLNSDQAVDVETTAVETTNINVTLTSSDTDGVATVAGATVAGDLNVVSNADLVMATIAASTSDVAFTVTGDLTVGGTALTAGTVDASGVTGDATITQSAVAAITITGAAGDNTITTAATTQDVEISTANGDDTVTLVTTTGAATLELGNGDNSVTANAHTTGALTITAGSGDDTVTTGVARSTGTLVLELGDGDNTVNLKDAALVSTVNISTGLGDDTIAFLTSTTGADVITIALGAGTDTLDLDGGAYNLSSATLSISGLDVIDTAGTATVDSSLVTGQTLTVISDGTNTGGVFTNNLLVTEGSDSKTINLANITFGSSIANGAGGVTVTTANGTNTVTTAAGNDAITGGTGVDTVTTGLGNDTVNGSGGADVMDLGGGNDTISATAAQIAVADLSAAGGAGTDTISITDAAAVDFTDGTFSGFELLTFAADATADAVVINQGIFSTGSVTFTLTGAADGDDDTLTITAGTVAWDVAGAEANAAAVNVAGEYFLDNTGVANGVLYYFNQTTGGVTAVTLTGLNAGAVALVAGDLVWTA
jgi:hypothetical protein